jgi:glutathione S-transferase
MIMKLYFSPGACSLSPHIVLLEARLPFTLEKVDLRSKTTAGGQDYRAINPKGAVPALEFDAGAVLTEGPAIVQYVADLAPASGLAPAAGTMARYQLAEWLNFISTELHKNYSPLFRPELSDELKTYARNNLNQRYAHVEKQLDGREYLMGAQFTAADAYLFVVTNWARAVKLDLSAFANLLAFQKRVAARPAVQQAMRDEGLLD